ncbi:hypothetical protein WJX72_003884 [[Myrmecia] bisecta]|uniref:DNA polymerase alpha subunit B n=1 Tax=[Myrmecia] bisecta TaxID=41462 RepID=A0AAW1QPY8_9CHLO
MTGADFKSAFKTRKLTCEDGLQKELELAAETLQLTPAALAQAYFLFVLNRKGSSNHITKESWQAFTDHQQQQHQKKSSGRPAPETLTFNGPSWEALSEVLGDNTNLQHETPTRTTTGTGTKRPDSVPRQSQPAGHTPFQSRTQRGHVQATLNQQLSLPGLEEGMDIDGRQRCSVRVLESAEPRKQTFMVDRLQHKVEYLESRITAFAGALETAEGTAASQSVASVCQENALVVGRICCDSEGKLNNQSVLLEGSQAASGGTRTQLRLDNVPSFRIFPGQIVGVRGVKSSGHCLVASELITTLPQPMPASTSEQMAQYASATGPSGLSVVVAAGPFTCSEDVRYEPLQALLDYCQAHPVDVLLLLGPFVDSEHAAVADGSLDDAFQDVFEAQVLGRLERWLSTYGASTTHVVMLPSTRDVHHAAVFPQPPFPTPASGRITMLPNPATFCCNEVVFGCATTDILKHLSGQQLTKCGQAGEGMTSLAMHVLGQRSYYPMYPPAAGTMLDSALGAALQLPVTPDVLLLPSDLAPFARLAPVQPVPSSAVGSGEVVVINPGRLTKGSTGGQFAHLQIGALKEGMAAGSGQLPTTAAKLAHRVDQRCKVLIKKV